MRASRVPLKREATHFEGLATPNESMSTPGTPPKEEEDDDKGRLSNILEAALFMSNDGLPRDNVSVEVDEGYGTQGAERKVRSASRKFLLLLLPFNYFINLVYTVCD
jgi:hypothetical protein